MRRGQYELMSCTPSARPRKSFLHRLMKTRITELFAIRHPIVQDGAHFISYAKLAAAVSNTGGFGIITGLTQHTPSALMEEIRRRREMSNAPFDVNLTRRPAVETPD